MTDPSRVRVTGPHEPFAAGFAAELARQGYTPGSASQQMRLTAHLSRWLAAKGKDAAALSSDAVEAFLASRRAPGAKPGRYPPPEAILAGGYADLHAAITARRGDWEPRSA